MRNTLLLHPLRSSTLSLLSTLAALAISPAVAQQLPQYPAAFQVGFPLTPSYPMSGMALGVNGTNFGFGDASDRVLYRNTAGDIGWFSCSTGTPTFQPFAPGSLTPGISKLIWERNPVLPLSAFTVRNVAGVPQVTLPTLAQVFTSGQGFAPVTVLSNSASDIFTADAVNAANQRFYLRRTTSPLATSWNLATCGIGTLPTLWNAVPQTTGSLALSANDTRIAYPAGSQLNFFNVPAVGFQPAGVSSVSFTAGDVVSDVAWVDNRFVVCRVRPAALPLAGRVFRVDTQAPFAIDALTHPPEQVFSLRMSGDRRWLALGMQHSIPGTIEKGVFAMQISSGATASPGGAYVVVHPSQTYSNAPAPIIQGRSNTLDPHIMFEGNIGAAPLSFQRAELLREVTIAGRSTTATSTAATMDWHHEAADVTWFVGASFNRLNDPLPAAILVDMPVVVGPFAVGTAPLFNTSATLTVPAAGIGFELFLQPGWFTNTPAGLQLNVGRVTHLPIF